MADPAQTPEVGGGEGAVASPPDNSQETKPEVATIQPPSEVKNGDLTVQVETKHEPSQSEPIKQKEAPAPEQGQKDEKPILDAGKQEDILVTELVQKNEENKFQEVAPVELVQKVEEQKLEAVKQEETPVTEVVQKTEEQKLEAVKQEETPVTEVVQKTEEQKLEAVKQEETVPPVLPTNKESTLEDGKVQEAGDNSQKPQDKTTPKQLDWQQRELELLKKIDELEKVKNERSEDGLKLEIKVREEEIDLLKARVRNLETELQAAMSKPGGKNHEMIENIKQQHEELLSKARGMIFDKTKMVKNQELQIEALTTQVQSLKDINVITKDLLEIRNSEVKAMEERLQAMEARFKTEKDRYGLVLQRAQTSTNINDDLRKEYETQLAIFKELREKYEQRVQALMAENQKLKEESLKGGTSG